MVCCKTQRKCSDSTYVGIAFLLISGVLLPITVVTEVSFIIIFSSFFGKGWFPRVPIINQFTSSPLPAVFPADVSLRLAGVTGCWPQTHGAALLRVLLLRRRSSTCAGRNFSPGISSSTAD